MIRHSEERSDEESLFLLTTIQEGFLASLGMTRPSEFLSDLLVVQKIHRAHLAEGFQVCAPTRNYCRGGVARFQFSDCLGVAYEGDHFRRVEIAGIKFRKRGGNFDPHSHGLE